MAYLNKFILWIIVIAALGFVCGAIMVALAPFIMIGAVLMLIYYAVRQRVELGMDPIAKTVRETNDDNDDGIMVQLRTPVRRYDDTH